MDKERINGLQARIMKVNGTLDTKKVTEFGVALIAILLSESGVTINLMGLANMCGALAISMKVNGKLVFVTDRVATSL
mgnify:CR=1 FL=1